MRFAGAVRRDPAVEDWFTRHPDPLRLMARFWFERMRACGGDVRELLHDGCPVACVGDAAFGYVNAFRPMPTSAFSVARRCRTLPDCSKALARGCAT